MWTTKLDYEVLEIELSFVHPGRHSLTGPQLSSVFLLISPVCSIVGYGVITVFYHCNIAVCLSFLQMSVYFSSVVGRYMLTTVTVDDLILLSLCKVFFASFYSF